MNKHKLSSRLAESGSLPGKSGKTQAGFTLVELLIATTFFSFVLLFIASGFIQVNRIYQSVVITKNAQNTARAIFDQFSHDAKGGGGIVDHGSGCWQIGSVYYILNSAMHELRRSVIGCADPGLLVHESNLGVYKFEVTPVKATAGASVARSAQLGILIGVADASLVDVAADRCQISNPTVLHICSVLRFDTSISLRGESS